MVMNSTQLPTHSGDLMKPWKTKDRSVSEASTCFTKSTSNKTDATPRGRLSSSFMDLDDFDLKVLQGADTKVSLPTETRLRKNSYMDLEAATPKAKEQSTETPKNLRKNSYMDAIPLVTPKTEKKTGKENKAVSN